MTDLASASKPMKLTICGSARHKTEIDRVNRRLSLQGHAVYSLVPRGRVWTDGQRKRLFRAHLAKIDNSDAVYVVAPDGVLGAGLAEELAYAKSKGKRVLGDTVETER
jgi:hypothetical protein